MSAIFVLLVLMSLFFLLAGARDILVWFGQRRKQGKDETKKWAAFHNNFERDRR